MAEAATSGGNRPDSRGVYLINDEEEHRDGRVDGKAFHCLRSPSARPGD